MRRVFYVFNILLIFLTLTGCNYKTADSINQLETNLTYEQYQKLILLAKNELIFKKVPMELSESFFSNPTIMIVNKNMSFGKKEYLTLNNEQTNPTQNFLTYEDKQNDYKLMIGWIYTDINQGNNLLYFKPYIKGESTDFDNILSYKNILIHVQLTSLSSNPTQEAFGNENALILTELVDFLDRQKKMP